MRHPVIPAPARFDGGQGEFVFRSGTKIAYTDAAVALVVERFCSQVTPTHGAAPGADGRRPGIQRTVRQGRARDRRRPRRAARAGGCLGGGRRPC